MARLPRRGCTGICALIAMTTVLTPCAGGAPHVWGSKISLHLINHYSEGARRVVRAGPPVLKILDLHEPMLEALRDYKTRFPKGRSVLRIYTETRYARDADPAQAGREFWFSVLAPALDRLSREDRRLIDYLEGPNECEFYRVWESVETAAWAAEFWRALAPLMGRAGYRPCISNIPVGNPPGTPDQIRELLHAFAPALLAVNRVGGCWSYHAYSLRYGTDLAEENWTSLRYRMLREMITEKHPELAGMPVIITEAGIDDRGDARQDGWQARGDEAKFIEWLTWFDARLREDEYVLGATLFQCGDVNGWPSFETEPINPWLAGHIARSRPRNEENGE